MKKLNQEFILLVSSMTGKNSRMIVVVATIVLFILGAGAPNATIGIGK